jgi:hypothetical protein
MKNQKIHESWNDVLDMFEDSGEFTQEKYIEWVEQISIATGSRGFSLDEFKQEQKKPCHESTMDLVLIWRLKLPFTINL